MPRHWTFGQRRRALKRAVPCRGERLLPSGQTSGALSEGPSQMPGGPAPAAPVECPVEGIASLSALVDLDTRDERPTYFYAGGEASATPQWREQARVSFYQPCRTRCARSRSRRASRAAGVMCSEQRGLSSRCRWLRVLLVVLRDARPVLVGARVAVHPAPVDLAAGLDVVERDVGHVRAAVPRLPREVLLGRVLEGGAPGQRDSEDCPKHDSPHVYSPRSPSRSI